MIVEKHQNLVGSDVQRFYDEFSCFICTFRLGISPKRNHGIDPSKYITEIFVVLSDLQKIVGWLTNILV